MDYLIRVFKDKSFLGDSIERLPDDIKVLREKYQINYPEENIRNKLDHGEPTDVSDIKASVIWNTILRLVCKFVNTKAHYYWVLVKTIYLPE